MSREANKRVEIRTWTTRHRGPHHSDYECDECREAITYGGYIRRVLRVYSKKGTREYTHLVIHREHVCCPDLRRS